MTAPQIRCLYLIQAEGSLPEIYNDLRNKDFLLLSYKNQTDDTNVFMPNSTWTTGRNKLREQALKLKKKYDYYIFLDQDVVFLNGKTFDDFEQLLVTYKPHVAVPNFNAYKYPKIGNINTTLRFDGLYNAFSEKVFTSPEIFPYITTFDDTNWFASQYCMICSCLIHNIDVLVFHDITVKNTQHGSYPKNKNFAPIKSHMLRLNNLKNLPTFKPRVIK